MPTNIVCRIKEILKKRALSQDWLATEAKIDPGDLSRLAQGKRTPRIPAARRIARVLELPIETIWPDTVPKRHK